LSSERNEKGVYLQDLEFYKSQNEELRTDLDAITQNFDENAKILKQLKEELEKSKVLIKESIDWSRIYSILQSVDPFIPSFVDDHEAALIVALENLKSQYNSKVETITSLQTQLDLNEGSLRESENALQKTREELLQKDLIQSELEDTISRLREDVNTMESTLREKEASLSALVSESIRSDQYASALVELENLKLIQNEKESEIQTLLSELNGFKADAVHAVELQHLNQQLKSEIQDLVQEQLKLKDEIVTLSAQLATSAENSQEDGPRIDALIQEKSLLEQELLSLTSKLTDIEQVIADANVANAQWQEYAQTLEIQLSALQQEFENISERNVRLEESKRDTVDLERLQMELSKIQKTNVELEEKLSSSNSLLQTERENWELKNSEIRSELSEKMELAKRHEIRLEEQIKELNEILDEFKRKAENTDSLQKRYDILEVEKLQFQNELNAKLLEAQSYQEKLNEALAQLNEFNHHYYDLENNFNLQSQELQEKIAMITNLEYENTQLIQQTNLKADSSELDRLASQVVELQAVLDEMTQREINLKAKLDEAVSMSHDKQIEKLQVNHHSSLETQLQKANQKIKALERDVTTLAELLKSATSNDPNGRKISHSEYIQLFRKAARVDLLEHELEQMSKAIDLAQLDADNLRKAIQESERPNAVDGLHKLLLNESEAVKKWMQLYQNYQQESENAKEASQIQIMELREEFDELAILFEHTSRELEQLKSQMDDHGVMRQVSHMANFGPSTANFPVQELAALNKLVVSLEGERNSLNAEVSIMKQKYESLLQTKEKELDLLNSKLARVEVTDRIALEEYKNRAQSLEFEVKELRVRLQEVTLELQQAAHDLRNAEKRIVMLENERSALLEDQHHQRELFDSEIYHAINSEQLRARDHLNFKLKELRSSFDVTVNEMIRKQNQLEQMLDESERLLIADRETFHHREQQLLDELRFIQKEGSGRWVHDHRNADMEQERMHLENKLHNLHLDNRRLRKAIDTQGSQFLKERYDMLSEIATLKADLEALEFQSRENDNSRIVKTLQEQKSVRMTYVGIRISA
jgi:chromosome segregation ATPase